jgi:hypothetical protein
MTRQFHWHRTCSPCPRQRCWVFDLEARGVWGRASPHRFAGVRLREGLFGAGDAEGTVLGCFRLREGLFRAGDAEGTVSRCLCLRGGLFRAVDAGGTVSRFVGFGERR